MINSVYINGLYHPKNNIKIKINDKLFIVTGDNGAGKTTLLNLVFTVLNGEFEKFFKFKFENIVVFFEENTLALKELDVKKEHKEIVSTYRFESKIVKVYTKLESKNEYSFEYKILDVNQRKTQDQSMDMESDEDYYFYKSIPKSIEELVYNNEDLDFIMSIRNSILYFPSYRRIDSDLESLKEFDSDYNINPFFYNRTNNEKTEDRRVVGVKEEDIENLFNDYSNELRDYNSKGLDGLLKTFIEGVIKGLYTKEGMKLKQDTDGQQAEHLLDLAGKLGIDNIDKEKVYEYYENQIKVKEQLRELNTKRKKNVNNKSKKEYKETEIGRLLEQISILREFIEVLGEDKKHVKSLVNLYMEHLKGHEKELETYHYLKKGFEEFFGNEITINLNSRDYTVKMSKKYAMLSTGQKQIVTFLTYIELNLDDSTFNPLIIIDEPELSLHVSWQSKLINQLLNTEKKTTLIIATHSPFVAKTTYSNSTYQIGDIDETF